VRAEYEERLAQAVAKAANLAQQLRTEKGNSGGGHGGDGGHSHSSHSLSPLPLSPSLTAGGADSGFAAVQMALAETRLKVQQTGAASAPSPAPASLPWLTPTPHRLPPPRPAGARPQSALQREQGLKEFVRKLQSALLRAKQDHLKLRLQVSWPQQRAAAAAAPVACSRSPPPTPSLFNCHAYQPHLLSSEHRGEPRALSNAS